MLCNPQTAPGDPLGSSGTCNADLPNSTAYARFLYVLRFLTANGFYVLIDNHLSFDNTAVSNTAQWLAWWKQLMTDVAALPSTRNRVMVDIMNEPDVLGLRCVPFLPVATMREHGDRLLRCRMNKQGEWIMSELSTLVEDD